MAADEKSVTVDSVRRTGQKCYKVRICLCDKCMGIGWLYEGEVVDFVAKGSD